MNGQPTKCREYLCQEQRECVCGWNKLELILDQEMSREVFLLRYIGGRRFIETSALVIE